MSPPSHSLFEQIVTFAWLLPLFAWLISHAEAIHFALQCAALIIGCIGGILAAVYHWKAIRKLDGRK